MEEEKCLGGRVGGKWLESDENFFLLFDTSYIFFSSFSHLLSIYKYQVSPIHNLISSL